MIKKLFIFLLLTAYYLLNTPSAYAQVPSTSSGPSASPSASIPYTLYPIPSSVSPTSPLYMDLLVNNMFHSFSCLAVGQSFIGQPCLTYQFSKNTQGMLEGVPVLSQVNTSGGTLGAVTSVIGAMYQNPPVRTVDYLASVGQGFGIVKQANAQVVGSGAQILNPILKLWEVSRNISYVIMIIIFVVIGVMVMFRNRINPQTVITAQAALPGLVIGLILITFSYFLAGLISDMAFVGTNVVGYYFAAAQGQTHDPERINLVQKLKSENVLSIFAPLVGIVSSDQTTAVVTTVWDKLPLGTILQLRIVVSALFAQFIMPIGSLWGGIGTLIAGLTGAALGSLSPQGSIGLALSLIATVIIFYSMLRLLLRLVNAYLNIIFLTVSAPFQFLFASLPGRQGIATDWILNFLGHALAFPAVLAVLYFVALLLGPNNLSKDYPLKVSNLNSTQNNQAFTVYAQSLPKTVVDKDTFPLLGGMDLNFISLLLAFGALVALPAIPDIVQRAIGKASQAGQLIGQEIGSNVGVGRGYYDNAARLPSHFTGQIGQLTNKPGYIGVEKEGNKVSWEKSWNPMHGAQAGTASRTKAALSSFFGNFRKKP